MRIRLLPRTVRGLSIIVALVSSLVILLIGAGVVMISHEEIERQIDHRIELEMEALLDFRRTHSTAELAELVQARDGVTAGNTGYLASVDKARRVTGYAVIDTDGRRLAGSLRTRLPIEGWDEFFPIRRADGSRGTAQAVTRRLPDGGYLIVAGDRFALNQSDDRMIMLILAGLGAVLLTGVLSTIAFGRIVHRRLAAISQTAQGIMAGDFSRRVALDGSDGEFDRLSQALNAMLTRIEELMRNLRQVSSDIAHDMRTPLTRIRNQMDELLRNEDRAASPEALQRMIDNTDSVLDLFSGLLSVSEIEGFAARKRFRDVRLDSVVEQVADAYRPTFHDEGRYLELMLQPGTIDGDEKLLMCAVANLLENVLAHAGPGAGVHIDMFADGANFVLRVADDGVGIAAGSETLIFERLARLEASRSAPGHGLGLSMVRAIAQLHRGTVKADASARGLAVTITIPVAGSGDS